MKKENTKTFHNASTVISIALTLLVFAFIVFILRFEFFLRMVDEKMLFMPRATQVSENRNIFSTTFFEQQMPFGEEIPEEEQTCDVNFREIDCGLVPGLSLTALCSPACRGYSAIKVNKHPEKKVKVYFWMCVKPDGTYCGDGYCIQVDGPCAVGGCSPGCDYAGGGVFEKVFPPGEGQFCLVWCEPDL